jgi:hypothetical protein
LANSRIPKYQRRPRNAFPERAAGIRAINDAALSGCFLAIVA